MIKKPKASISRLPYIDYNADLKSFERLSRRGILIKPIGLDKFWASDLTLEIFELDGKNRIYSLDEIQKKIADNEFQKLITAFRKMVASQKQASLELKLSIEKESSRKTKYIKLHLDLRKDKEGTSFIFASVHDITKRKKKNDDQDRAIERAEQSDKIKTAFLTNLSYEIRNPMNTIVGYSELMNSTEIVREQQLEYSRLIVQKGKKMLSLLDDIIELSKMESGERKVNPVEIDLQNLLLEMQEFYNKEKKRFQKDDILIFIDFPKNPPKQYIVTDEGRLQQLFSILMNNALKYTEKGNIQIGYEWLENKQVKFFVKDTGIGIPRDDQKTLFDHFRKIEFTTNRKFPDSGLGLALAKSIVDLLGGKIGIESEQSTGSTFFFTLPLARYEKNISSDRDERFDEVKHNWKNKVVLIVDDEEVNQKFLEAVLSHTQTQILFASNGSQAVELCRTIPKIDIILMDIKMPVMNGIEAYSEIKKIKNIPIIAQTAYTPGDIDRNFSEKSFDEYITKPLDIKSLLTLMNKYLAE